MKTLDYREWAIENYGQLSELQGVLNPYKPNKKKVPVIIYNDILHFIVGYSYEVSGSNYFNLRLKSCGENQQAFTIRAYNLDLETLKYLTS